MRVILTCWFVSITLSQTWGQDPQFSQYYSAPLYLNPAYAGYTEGTRANVSYRNQWRDAGSFNTFSASADASYECGKIRMGSGIILMNDQQSSEVKTLTGGVVLVPPVIKAETYSVRIGAYIGGGQRSYQLGRGVFVDQLTPTGVSPQSNDPLTTASLSTVYFDAGLGGLIDFDYSGLGKNKDWIGVSVYHLNQPTINVGSTQSYRLPMRINIHVGSQLKMNGWELTPVANFRMQSSLRQLDLGTYLTYYSPKTTTADSSPTYSLVLGLFYRGIPLSKSLNQVTQDALIGLIGLQNNNLSFNFSYDVTTSKLAGYTGNTFEITLSYINLGWVAGCVDLGNRQKRKSAKSQMRCPR
ncbi:PorP/SprF family type IX secretion system membrane protein [Spirosoma endophyticum]|uniref:Type IX secretion system membrane protein, PorP/SprF family n=1 Tax=Spirosoma endophyticum TaxID=662367 RepID=A0A1I2GHP0_9BACT|nr:PorP/SprF family type IX secretion system membrane protein [Spirosoma endophyticum]SFF16141.1 type IX secretion system membrane protein, PorP/SprF family [Spirosoma endophyticum]